MSEALTEHFMPNGWHFVTHNALYSDGGKTAGRILKKKSCLPFFQWIYDHYLVLSYPIISTWISFVKQFDSPDYFLLTPKLSSNISWLVNPKFPGMNSYKWNFLPGGFFQRNFLAAVLPLLPFLCLHGPYLGHLWNFHECIEKFQLPWGSCRLLCRDLPLCYGPVWCQFVYTGPLCWTKQVLFQKQQFFDNWGLLSVNHTWKCLN